MDRCGISKDLGPVFLSDEVFIGPSYTHGQGTKCSAGILKPSLTLCLVSPLALDQTSFQIPMLEPICILIFWENLVEPILPTPFAFSSRWL